MVASLSAMNHMDVPSKTKKQKNTTKVDFITNKPKSQLCPIYIVVFDPMFRVKVNVNSNAVYYADVVGKPNRGNIVA